jgi:hypothetical protein
LFRLPVTGYSPLSRLEELEILTLGVQGKLLLWQALAADSQRRRLGRLRLEAASEALGVYPGT